MWEGLKIVEHFGNKKIGGSNPKKKVHPKKKKRPNRNQRRVLDRAARSNRELNSDFRQAFRRD